MSAESTTGSPVPTFTGQPAKGGQSGFLLGVVVGLVVGLFIGALAMPMFESRRGAGPVTNNPEPGRGMKPVSPEQREGIAPPAEETKRTADDPGTAEPSPATPERPGGGGTP